MKLPRFLCWLLVWSFSASQNACLVEAGRKNKVETSSAKAVVPVEKDRMLFPGRPSADAGLRYSSNDWITAFISIPVSYILRRIRFHLLTNVAICLAVLHYHPTHSLSIPMTGHSLLASSLGLLVSFRTNSAYSRFYEARGYWTSTKATCRNLAILMKSHVSHHSPRASRKFLSQLTAFPATLMYLCLGGAVNLPDYVLQVLPPLDEQALQEQPALPAILLCTELQKTLHSAMQESGSCKFHLVEAAHLNEASHHVDHLLDYTSKCEKILRTPVPWTYSRHASRFLTLWLGTLPFALVGTLNKWLVLATVVAASYCMLGIEEIGHLIEQPFLGDAYMDEEDSIWNILRTDNTKKQSALIRRGLATKPYDIGIPVVSLAAQIRQEINKIANFSKH